MTLFDDRRKAILNRQAPLATRMRPRNLDEFVGQQKLVGPGRVVRRMIERDRLHSMILWGPPGSGKTTLAQVISGVTKSYFAEMSAVTSGVRDIRSEAADAQHRIGSTGTRTILFVDEIHRFSKSQQDALLPHVEAGTFILIGATTENPSFEVNAPLLSRTRVYTIEPLEDADMNRIIDAALGDLERGLAAANPTLDDAARSFLLRASNGDARSALNAVEVAVDSAAEEDGQRNITVELVEQAIEKRSRYDRLGDMHYDTISAFIKSIRASDPDAAVYYLARMIDAGEDPLFIARRLVISAAEDIGLANPNGLGSRGCGSAGRQFRRHAGRSHPTRRSDDLSRLGAKIELRVPGDRQGSGTCPRKPRRTGPDAPPQRANGVNEADRLRRRLRVPPRCSREFRGSGKSAREGARQSVLRAGRTRCRTPDRGAAAGLVGGEIRRLTRDPTDRCRDLSLHRRARQSGSEYPRHQITVGCSHRPNCVS